MQPTAPSLAWGLPFAGLLASMAMFPIVAPRFWHRRMGSVAFAWSAVLLVQEAFVAGIGSAAAATWHAVVIEYLPFVTLLLALYTAGGGTLLRYEVHAQVGGKIAQLGARLIDASAKQMADAFFDRFSNQVAPAPAPVAEPHAESGYAAPPPQSAISPLALVPREPFGLPLIAWIGSAIFLFMLLLILGSML